MEHGVRHITGLQVILLIYSKQFVRFNGNDSNKKLIISISVFRKDQYWDPFFFINDILLQFILFVDGTSVKLS